MGPVITCSDLSYSFGKVTAVDGVSLEVQPGERFALLGPNGAGKTTTFQMLITMLRPVSGQARVMGYDVADDPAVVRAHRGRVSGTGVGRPAERP